MGRLDARHVEAIARLTSRHPALGLRLAGTLGLCLGRRLGRRWVPSRSDVKALFGDAGPAEVGRIRRRIASAELRDHALSALIERRGIEGVLPLLRIVGAERLLALRRERVPAVLVFWHVGVRRAVPAALMKLEIPTSVAVLRSPRVADPAGVPVRYAEVDGVASGARFLKRALADLSESGVALVAIDGLQGDAFQYVSLLGRRVRFARGPAVLARLAAARCVPVTSRWLGGSGRIQVTVEEPLPEPSANRVAAAAEFENEILESAASWLEGRLRSQPGILRLGRLRRMAHEAEWMGRDAAGGDCR